MREISRWQRTFDPLFDAYDKVLRDLLQDIERLYLVDYCQSGSTLLYAGHALYFWLQKQAYPGEVELLALDRLREDRLTFREETIIPVRSYPLENFGSLADAFHCEFFDVISWQPMTFTN